MLTGKAAQAEIRASGVYGRGVNVILDNRPFATLTAFGNTAQIGEKTMQAIHSSTVK